MARKTNKTKYDRTESFSRGKSIKNKDLKGRDTTGMVQVKRGDIHNTVYFVESKEEAERVKPIYDGLLRENENIRKLIDQEPQTTPTPARMDELVTEISAVMEKELRSPTAKNI